MDKKAEEKCANLAHQNAGYKIGSVAAHRLLGLMTVPEQLIKIGPAFPLLVEIILRCGAANECEITCMN